MPDIYDQHRTAFSNVSAYVILRDGDKIATIAIKYPRDGAGRLWAYVHYLGAEMARGAAGGYGYDKTTAAIADAARRIKPIDHSVLAADMKAEGNDRWVADLLAGDAAANAELAQFRAALEHDGGHNWDASLRRAGFTVLQAV
jgi:hypothetical protein